MNIRHLATGLLALTLAAPLTAQTPGNWKPADAPLLTQWADDVDAKMPLPEYPRPQMVRDDWQNLNGLWQFKMAERMETFDAAPGGTLGGEILVPFAPESALSGVGKRVDSFKVWYQRDFTFDEDWRVDNKRVLLHFGAVDWQTHVFVNGQKVGTHEGGFDPFSFDVTDALQDGKNTVSVGVYDPTDGEQPRGKQNVDPSGIFYTPVTGIWQTVWLESVPTNYITDLKIVPDPKKGEVKVTVNTSRPGPVSVAIDGNNTARGRSGRPIAVQIDDPELWSTSNPHLYDFTATLMDGDEAVDAVDSYFGLRSISLHKGDDGNITAINLNGEPLFQVGPLDQGWWPDGLYTAPTDEALKYDIEITKKLGFNMIRKHVKVEPARWYYHCDQMGMLVWQDMVSPFEKQVIEDDVRVGEEMHAIYEHELREMIADFYNHPSIIMWVVFNEGWGQHQTEEMTALTKKLDPTRLASNASGWTDRNVGDIRDIHAYPDPRMEPLEDDRAFVVGETGGFGLTVKDHLWQPDRLFEYRGYPDGEALTEAYETFMSQVYAFRKEGLAAVVYTQTTDVEGEINGLLTYDRKVVKVDQDRVRKANEGHVMLALETTVEPVATENRVQWQYTTQRPAGNWMKPGFEASNWQRGEGSFGTTITPGADVGTQWDTGDIWLRREIEISEDDLDGGELHWKLHHDEDVKIYLDGELVLEKDGFVAGYALVPVGEAAAMLTPGKHLIAMHCHQTTGGQNIDVGLTKVKEIENDQPREDVNQ